MRGVWVFAAVALLGAAPIACSDDGGADTSDVDDGDGGTDEPAEAETLAADFEGAPEEIADGRMTCLGDNAPEAPTGSVLQLTGYVRTLADPDGEGDTPAASVEAFSSGDVSLGTGFADASKAGRVTVSVPVTEDGFDGYVLVSHDGYLDWRFQTNLAVSDTHLSGWAWLTRPAERDALAEDLGVTLEADTGILVGAIHDCDAFGVASAVVTVDGDHAGVYYIEGFAPVTDRTWTSPAGRFVVPNLSPGSYEVKAWGRLAAGEELTLLSAIPDVVVDANRMTAVALQPRAGVTQ